jgi:hypothetical protein
MARKENGDAESRPMKKVISLAVNHLTEATARNATMLAAVTATPITKRYTLAHNTS